MRISILFAFVIILTACGNETATSEADIIVHNATVYTVNEKFNIVQSFAIKNGKIVATGTDAEILKNYKAKETIDAKGQAVYPGFIDAHSHFVGYGQSLF